MLLRVLFLKDDAVIIYSKKIVRFLDEIKSAIKDILSREIRLKVWGNRFYNFDQTSSYPIKVVIYNNKSMLGYFDSHFLELGFHESLMHTSRAQLHHVIRHELAHYMTFILYGEYVQAHGTEFRAFCKRQGWGEEVYMATTCLDDGQNTSDKEECAVLRKVQKLMALTTSSNANEAELAMIKAQQLLLKHNIDATYMDGEEDEKVFLKRIMKQKKEDAKMRAIAHILTTFFVNTVYNRAGGFIYLEILGSAVNIEIAEYVASFLQVELDKHWYHAQKYANLKGMIAKNSFFLGLSKGYCDKIQALKRQYSNDVSSALLVIEKKLGDAEEMAYERLSSRRSKGNYCRESSAVGEKVGRQLNINPALNQHSKNLGLLLS